MDSRSSCNVFVRESHILVASSAQTISGIELIVDPVFELAVDATPSEIGQAALDSFSAYKVGVPDVGPDVAKMPNAVLKASGCRSWGHLDRSSLNLFLTLHSDAVTVIPTRRAAEGGSTHLRDRSIGCNANAESIGEAVRAALKDCS